MNISMYMIDGTLFYTVLAAIALFFIVLCAMFILLLKINAKSKQTQVAQNKPIQVLPAPIEQSDDELIAVITAAVASMMGTSPQGLKITSIRRVSKWNQ